MGNKVKVLRPGYTRTVDSEKGIFSANGTITLVSGEKNIIVDTGSPFEKDVILSLLQKEGLATADISIVINTHGHIDHTGNNNLFPEADFYSGFDICVKDLYTSFDFAEGNEFTITDSIRLIPVKGHTAQDICVVVKTKDGIIAIAGDLFESGEDINDESKWIGYSCFPEEQRANRKKIIEMADYIIPGHGEMFKV